MAKDIKIHGGKYLGGLTALYNGEESFKGTLVFGEKGVEFKQLKITMLALPLGSIVDVAVDSGAESVTRGVSGGRVAAFGVLGLLAPKTQTHGTGYVSITTASGETGIWEFEEQNSMRLKAKLSPWLRRRKIAAIEAETAAIRAANRARRGGTGAQPAEAQQKITASPAAPPQPAHDPRAVEEVLNVRNRRKFRDHCTCLAHAVAPAEQIIDLALADSAQINAVGASAAGPGLLAVTSERLIFVYADKDRTWRIAAFPLAAIASGRALAPNTLHVTMTEAVLNIPEANFEHMQPPVAEAYVEHLVARGVTGSLS